MSTDFATLVILVDLGPVLVLVLGMSLSICAVVQSQYLYRHASHDRDFFKVSTK